MDAPLTKAVTLVATCLTLIFLSSPAFAQYPQDAAIAGASDTTVRPGQRIVIGGEGWEPGSQVDLRWASSNLGQAQIDRRGEFAATISVPEESPGGEQFIWVAGVSGADESSEIAIRMLVDSPITPEDEVSFTSANLALWSLLAVGLLLVGLGAVLRGRRQT